MVNLIDRTAFLQFQNLIKIFRGILKKYIYLDTGIED